VGRTWLRFDFVPPLAVYLRRTQSKRAGGEDHLEWHLVDVTPTAGPRVTVCGERLVEDDADLLPVDRWNGTPRRCPKCVESGP
jgi:hypothetical protein